MCNYFVIFGRADFSGVIVEFGFLFILGVAERVFLIFVVLLRFGVIVKLGRWLISF